jgi:hypothetical protein
MGTLASALDEAVRIIDRVGPPPAVLKVLPRRVPRPGAKLPPEEVVEPSVDVREVVPAKKQKLLLGVAVVEPFGRVVDATRLQQFDPQELGLVLVDPAGHEYPGKYVSHDVREDVVVLFYEFNLARASVEPPFQRFELWMEWRDKRIETGIVVPISP